MSLVIFPKSPYQCRNLGAGSWREPCDGRYADLHSPYNGELIGRVALSSAADVHEIVSAAKQAFPGWRATPIKERSRMLFKFRELVLAQIDDLANTAALEAGKRVAEARAGIEKGLEVVEFALSLQNSAHGGRMEVSRGVYCQSQREPLGVVAGIVPFNFPAMVPLWMYPIALTLGNCFVLKPSEKVPCTSGRIADLISQAGFPPGVFSIINGAREAAEALVDHPDIKAVGFVGSTPAARAVYQRATALGKRALCLGGAKNAIILAPDADPTIAVRGIVDSFTGCAGQRCMAASLLLAVGEVDPLIDQITAQAAALAPGSGLGAIIDRAAFARIQGAIAAAEKDGATIRVDGRRAAAPAEYKGGNWIGPTVIDNAKPGMACATAEIFGPVLTIIRVASLSEALEIDGASTYGNATSVFTQSGAVAQYVAERASTGMIGINIGVPVPREPFSFGGMKQSKFGQGEITGMGSLDLWSNLKKITSKWSEQRDANWMS